MKLTTAAQMRELDRQAIALRGIPSIDLMEHAARHVAETALETLSAWPGRVAVFCGSGNNGGDGVGAARRLIRRGVRVRVFLVGDMSKQTPDTREELRKLAKYHVSPEILDIKNAEQVNFIQSADMLIDALFGVGLSREIDPESPYAAAIDCINQAPGKVLSVDIPSGIHADTGEIMGRAVQADMTVTFTAAKIGHAVGKGAIYSGDVKIYDIGIPEDLQKAMICPVQTAGASFVREATPKRKSDGHKGDFGKILIIGGSVGYTGAPYLTASAAIRSGCGLVFLGVPEAIWPIEAVKCVSAMPFPLPCNFHTGKLNYKSLAIILNRLKNCDILALGPGLGKSPEITRLVCELLKITEKPVILDADGINALSGHIDILDARRDRVTILTPHDGEFARINNLNNFIIQDRMGAARDFAMKHGCILVLKGHRTLTASPSGTVLVNMTGNSGLAKGGSGDILTGIIASLLAQGATPIQAAAAGVWLHGRAGDWASEINTPYAMTPEDVLNALPRVFTEITGDQTKETE